jgi:hypothetical protein
MHFLHQSTAGSGSSQARDCCSPQVSWSFLVVALPLSLSLSGNALAQQPVRPLPRLGSCPLGYTGSGGYCVPASGRSRGAIEKSGGSCPLGFSSSGNYCLSNPGSSREAIQKTGNSCPLGWSSSGHYCVKSR